MELLSDIVGIPVYVFTTKYHLPQIYILFPSSRPHTGFFSLYHLALEFTQRKHLVFITLSVWRINKYMETNDFTQKKAAGCAIAFSLTLLSA